MRTAALVAVLVLLAGSVLAEEHHDDRLDEALEDLDRAQATASATWTTLTLGALWGLAIGSLLGVAVPLLFMEDDRR